MDKRYLSTIEAAEYLGIAVGTLANFRSQGKGPCYYKLERRILYDLCDLATWLKNHKVFTDDEIG